MSGPIRSSPVATFSRENLAYWLVLSPAAVPPQFSPDTNLVLEALSRNGAMFFGELLEKLPGVLPSKVEQALSELAAYGFVTSDSFEGLRALLLLMFVGGAAFSQSTLIRLLGGPPSGAPRLDLTLLG